MRGHTATVNTLLDHGADINQLMDTGLSALTLCLSLHHPDYSTRYHLDQLSVFTHLDVNDVRIHVGGIPCMCAGGCQRSKEFCNERLAYQGLEGGCTSHKLVCSVVTEMLTNMYIINIDYVISDVIYIYS